VKKHGDELAELRAEMGSMEQRISKQISTEIAHFVGVIEERFVQLFGLPDEMYRGAVSELRTDRDSHRFDIPIHVPRE
jgi:hypothetical protein